MRAPTPASFSTTLAALEAAGEITRLRLLALLADAELTVSELMTILGQSQPRISRHLKLLVEAGLLDRHREGAWASPPRRSKASWRKPVLRCSNAATCLRGPARAVS